MALRKSAGMCGGIVFLGGGGGLASVGRQAVGEDRNWLPAGIYGSASFQGLGRRWQLGRAPDTRAPLRRADGWRADGFWCAGLARVVLLGTEPLE